jgi:pyridoxamine 5'-phosphate oxidase
MITTLDLVQRFEQSLEAARAAGNPWPEAMALATADSLGAPSVRMVLVRGWDERGFVFYTNERSRKGRELAERAQAALAFWWVETRVQIRIEGVVERVAEAEADAYFASRPRGHQIGAWASQQSQPLTERDDLLSEVERLEREYHGQPVPRPPHWGGYRVVPRGIEIWREQPNRLHERERFERTERGWTCELLQP